jgi:hypothetical protein
VVQQLRRAAEPVAESSRQAGPGPVQPLRAMGTR